MVDERERAVLFVRNTQTYPRCGYARRVRWCLAALVLIGCSDDPAETGGGTANLGTSGTRLKLAWRETPDGVRDVTSVQPLQYFDAERGEACRPWLWANGTQYCTPEPRNFEIHYADAGCTVPRALLRPPLPSWVSDGTYVYAPAQPTGETQYWDVVSNVCQGPFTAQGGPAGVPYALTEIANPFVEIMDVHAGPGPLEQVYHATSDGLMDPTYYAFDPAQDQLVALNASGVPTVLDVTPGHRLQPYYYEGSGISRRTGAFHDTVLNLDCFLGDYCVPYTADHLTFYADACTTPVEVVIVPPPDAVPLFAYNRGDAGVYPVGAKLTQQLWRKNSTGCDPAEYETPFGTEFHMLDPLIPWSQLESSTYAVDP